MSDKFKGYLLAIIAAATYGMNPLFALPLYEAGMDPDSVLFFRYLLALPIIGAMIKLRGRTFKLHRKEIIPLVVMGLLVATSSLTLFQSYTYMDAGIASTLLFIYPIIVAIIMAVFFKEKITLQTIFCIFLALAGIGLLSQNPHGETLSLVGTLLVLLSALSYAVYIVAVNKSVLKETATLKLTFYILLFGLSLFAVRVGYDNSLYIIRDYHLWFNVLALAIFPTAISFLCTTRAVSYIGSTPTSILGALEPVTALFFGITIFGEVLTVRISIGVSMIILAVTFIVAEGHLKSYLIRIRKLFPTRSLKEIILRKSGKSQ
ncbi:MAG: DMT family transporter [Phocaeicola sp.]